MSERLDLITLAHVVEPGDARMGALVERLGAGAVVDAIRTGTIDARHADGLRARLAAVDPQTASQQAAAVGARIIERTHADWPVQLDDLGDRRPFALWVRGPVDLATVERSIAVVGARAATTYGEAVCRQWCAEFSDQGFAVISGGAFGIDAAAHRATLGNGGTTVCVLASGVDVPYPQSHVQLIERIAETGVVMSESPVGVGVRRQRFLSRNRLIGALARTTLVVEAALRSGTASTAHAAADLGRPVLAVPGSVGNPMSAGCHRLIADGVATIAMSATDVLAMTGRLGEYLPPVPVDSARDRLSADEKRLLDAIPPTGSIGLDALRRESGLGLAPVAQGVAALTQAGFVVPRGAGWGLAGRG